ncbi:MAG: cell division protein ZapA [Rhodobacteraceae bacterium]|jgi:cell division protein ZapA|nr:cell division protein ZapA [Paracoccaceae bacterium]
MPEETIEIGGKTFEVACQAGEEHYLHAAARMLDTEARTLIQQIGRLPESRMLLMSGLMLADKTAGAEDRVRVLEEELGAARAEIERLRSAPKTRVEVPAIPAATVERLSELAARAESLADQFEQGA